MSLFLGQPIRRGRPRASYAEMGEFDLSLIREFKTRPELYDRNSPLFKDKILSAQRWQEISNKLGFDVALLKDRMLQLRNRYNIEKRRLEQLAAENPEIEDPESSPWPLFEHLQFLSDHIRPRRSYKRLIPNATGYEDEIRGMIADTGGYDSRKHSYSSTELSAQYFANVEVKEERDSDQTDDERESTENGVESSVPNHHHMQSQDQHNNVEQQHGNARNFNHSVPPVQVNPSITIRRIDTLRENNPNRLTNPYANSKMSQGATYAISQKHLPYHQQGRPRNRQVNAAVLSHISGNHQINRRYRNSPYAQQAKVNGNMSGSQVSADDGSGNGNGNNNGDGHNNLRNNYEFTGNPTERLKLDTRAHKYTAFGYFLSSLLEELPRDKALDLVQRFTSELVTTAARNDTIKKRATENGHIGSDSEGGGTVGAASPVNTSSSPNPNGVTNGTITNACRANSSTTDEEIPNSALLGI